MKKTPIFTFVLFIILSFQAKAQTQPQLQDSKFIGNWWDGMEMGGSSLSLKSNHTYTLTDDHMGEVYDQGKWKANGDKISVISNKGIIKIYTLVKVDDPEVANRRSSHALYSKSEECETYQGYCFFKSE